MPRLDLDISESAYCRIFLAAEERGVDIAEFLRQAFNLTLFLSAHSDGEGRVRGHGRNGPFEIQL